jgi:ATP-dependent HslUV protease ATP-binding subunit HslU
LRILTEPKSALVKQYQALLLTEGVRLEFSDDALREVARLAAAVNQQTENIGARRLATILENLLEDASFEASDGAATHVRFEAEDVRSKLQALAQDQELSRFIL